MAHQPPKEIGAFEGLELEPLDPRGGLPNVVGLARARIHARFRIVEIGVDSCQLVSQAHV